MTFEQWIFGKDFNNPRINGEWGLLHILILVFCIILIVGITLIFRKKDEKFKDMSTASKIIIKIRNFKAK